MPGGIVLLHRLRRLAAVLVALSALGPVPTASADTAFVVTGRGYGHGIGMSQYGAQGLAQHGWTYPQILTHYYTGAAVSGGVPNPVVRVLVATNRSSVGVASAASFTIEGRSLAAGSYVVRPAGGALSVVGPGGTRSFSTPATIVPGGAPLELSGTAYRGSLVIRAAAGGTLAVLNALPRESYLMGVVPGEMPSSWATEALRAQAVAARSYALAVGGHCSWPVAAGDDAVLCADVRDQVYGGKSAEAASTNAAVASTAGEVVTFGGAPATTYFFSTSGGATAAKADEWGGAPFPYLVSVPDPYDSVSPHHVWGPKDAETDCTATSPDCVFTAAQVREALALPATPLDLEVTRRSAQGRVATLATRMVGATAAFDGADARTRLALRSTWFSVGVLGLSRSPGTVTYGGRVTLQGLTRSGGSSGWGSAALERRRYGERAWTSVSAPVATGSWTSVRTPSIGTDYRVVSRNAAGPAVHVSVRTKVTAKAVGRPATGIVGSIAPAKRGVVVRLARKRPDGSWTAVARRATSSRGGFTFSTLRAGTYRARADAAGGYVDGSALVTLPR